METILLIDDEINILNAYSLMLEKKGYRVLKATDGNEGLKIMLSEDIGLVISDICMPKKNGLVVVKQIRRILKYRNIPIIILSGGGTKQNVYRGIELGVEAFLTKPCEMEKLCNTVQKILKSKKKKIIKKYENLKKNYNIWEQANDTSILLVYKNASVTDNLYEYLTEQFYNVYIEENIEKVEEIFCKKNIDLLIIEVGNHNDNNFKFLFNIFNTHKHIEIPIIVISEMKKELKILFDCLNLQVDKIINKPFEYKNLLKTISQVTDLQYLIRKLANSISLLEKKIKENNKKETHIVNMMRDIIAKLKNENLKITNNTNASREEKFQMFCENNKKIMKITNKISKTKKIFLNKKQNLLKAKRIIEIKLKSLDKKRLSVET